MVTVCETGGSSPHEIASSEGLVHLIAYMLGAGEGLEAVVEDNWPTVMVIGVVMLAIGLLLVWAGSEIGGLVFLVGLGALLLGAWLRALKAGN